MVRILCRDPIHLGPMRIAHYILRYWLSDGGPIRAITDLSNQCALRGHEVALITPDDREAPESWKANSGPNHRKDHARLIKVPGPSLPGGFFRPSELRRVREVLEGFDVLHLHGVWVPSAMQAGSAARDINKPYVLSVRGMLDDWCMEQQPLKKKAYMALGARKMLERAACVHCTAQFEFEQARKHFPRGRGLVIPNLMDLKPFATLPGPEMAIEKFEAIRSGRPSVLFLSRVHVKKGIEILVESAAIMRKRGEDINVLIAGDGDESYIQEVKAHIEKLGMSDRVYFLGMVTGPVKFSLFQACRLFVLPTYQENFGFVFYESLGCATPVITTPEVDTWPELESSGGAVIVKRDAQKYADAMSELIKDPERLKRMGAAGRAWLFENLDPIKVVSDFEKLYQGAMGLDGVKPGVPAMASA